MGIERSLLRRRERDQCVSEIRTNENREKSSEGLVVAELKKAKSLRKVHERLRERNNKDCEKGTTEAEGKKQSRLRERNSKD